MSSTRWLPLILVAVFGLTACPPPAEEPAEETTPAPEITPEPMVQQEIAVHNGTMEPLTVVAMIEGRQEQLGMVQPNDSATFRISGTRGSSVNVEARNPAGEVIERQTIQVTEMRRDWRLAPPTDAAPGAMPQGAQPGAQPEMPSATPQTTPGT